MLTINRVVFTCFIALGLGVQASAQATCPDPIPAQPTPPQLIACVVEMKAEIERLETKATPVVPTGSIVMTDRECAALGSEWELFSKAGGRFPVARGTATDVRGETITFGQDMTGGAYKHLLSEAEMPSHTHAQRVGQHAVGGEKISAWNLASPRTGGIVVLSETGHRGQNVPHNNMPPYIALNFCIKQ